jgi:hypothetical protein
MNRQAFEDTAKLSHLGEKMLSKVRARGVVSPKPHFRNKAGSRQYVCYLHLNPEVKER